MSLTDRLVAGIKAAVGGSTVYATPDRIPVFSDPTVGSIADFVSLRDVMGMSPAALYRSQPHLRTVVDFVARNIAQLGVHAYRLQADGGRERDRTSPLARAFLKANDNTTGYELIRDLVSDLMLYDEALWHVVAVPAAVEIRAIRASWIMGRRRNEDDQWVWVLNRSGADRRNIEVPVEQTIHFHGWDPQSVGNGITPVETLKGILTEQMSASTFRDQLWRNGGRIGTYLTRPAGAPGSEWSEKARDRFVRAWQSQFAGNSASRAGSTPVLEDGMTLNRVGFSAGDEQYVEGAKLAMSTVASVYHVNPTMIGVLDNANYSNVREFRRMLYGDTLGPTLAMIEQRMNAFLLPLVGVNDGAVYLEFNIQEKLQGSFEEQAAVLSSSVGGPWLTRNEARAMNNRQRVDGGDDLLTPLNMGTLADAATVDPADPPATEPKALPAGRQLEVKARGKVRPSAASEAHVKAVAQVLAGYFARQRVAVLRAMAAGKSAPADVKAPSWWEGKRWDRELADDLFGVALAVAAEVGQDTAKALGFDPADYDQPRTVNFLKAVAATRAGFINAATRAALENVTDEDYDGESSPDAVFDDAEKGGRGTATALTLVTTLTGFASVEAGRQLAPDAATKTWRTTSGNPRSAHKRMNGETVGIDDEFSNGAKWAGDPSLGADGVAGCQCIIDINIP